MVKDFVICISRRLNFSVIAIPPLKNIGGGEHYLKEELEATLPHRFVMIITEKYKCVKKKRREWIDIVLQWCIYFVEENLDFEARLLAT